jgi:hypothetical protein
MGGYFSTRWNSENVREHTDPLLSLDVRWLNRMGALKPGAVFYPQWTRGGKPSGDIVTRMSNDGGELILDYRVRSHGEERRPVRDAVWLDWTACNYGGERVWFRCPGCNSRRAVLFSVGGRFRCRKCHDLAYSSTREDASDRSRRRMDVLRKRLGAKGGSLWDIPRKPDRMRWSTYWAICSELDSEMNEQMRLFYDKMASLDRQIGKLVGK